MLWKLISWVHHHITYWWFLLTTCLKLFFFFFFYKFSTKGGKTVLWLSKLILIFLILSFAQITSPTLKDEIARCASQYSQDNFMSLSNVCQNHQRQMNVWSHYTSFLDLFQLNKESNKTYTNYTLTCNQRMQSSLGGNVLVDQMVFQVQRFTLLMDKLVLLLLALHLAEEAEKVMFLIPHNLF